jgi:arylformamidase
MTQKWIDVTVTIQSGMVHWPDNPEIRVERMMDMERGDICNVSHLSLGSHTGTHMDAPLHFVQNGKSLDQMPFAATMGPARVIEITHKEAVTVEEIHPHKIRAEERVLFKTRNSKRSWKMDHFDEDFIYISREAAKYLADRKVVTVGIDYLSVGGFKKDGVETHHALLRAGIWVIEGLNLAKIKPGKYDLVCLPMKILNSDGAPARAILRPK